MTRLSIMIVEGKGKTPRLTFSFEPIIGVRLPIGRPISCCS